MAKADSRRTYDVACDRELALVLAKVIQTYADAAYPPGGSECAQVARTTLLDSAKSCATHNGGTMSLRKRQLPTLRAALAWYAELARGRDDEIVERLTGLLKAR